MVSAPASVGSPHRNSPTISNIPSWPPKSHSVKCSQSVDSLIICALQALCYAPVVIHIANYPIARLQATSPQPPSLAQCRGCCLTAQTLCRSDAACRSPMLNDAQRSTGYDGSSSHAHVLASLGLWNKGPQGQNGGVCFRYPEMTMG